MKENKEEEIVIDAENAVLGRLASFAAKQALQGKKVVIVNSEKAIVVGSKENIVNSYKITRMKGGASLKGPLFPSSAERILKRTIRGMLPYKKGRGRKALKSVLCYNSIPDEFKDKKMFKAGRGKKGISLSYIARMLRGGNEKI